MRQPALSDLSEWLHLPFAVWPRESLAHRLLVSLCLAHGGRLLRIRSNLYELLTNVSRTLRQLAAGARCARCTRSSRSAFVLALAPHWRMFLRVPSPLPSLVRQCIPADVIMRCLTDVLLKRVDDQIKHEIIQEAAFYDHRMHQGSKAIFHLEAFVAKFMAIYRRWITMSFA